MAGIAEDYQKKEIKGISAPLVAGAFGGLTGILDALSGYSIGAASPFLTAIFCISAAPSLYKRWGAMKQGPLKFLKGSLETVMYGSIGAGLYFAGHEVLEPIAENLLR